MVNRAQLAASLAAPFRQYQLDAIPAAPTWQHQGNQRVPGVSLKNKTICITGGFDAHASSLHLRVALMYIDRIATHLQNLYIIHTQF